MTGSGATHSARRQHFILLAGWLAVFALMTLVWSAPLFTGKLPGPDDYLRMERVFAIVDGQNLPAYAAPGLGIDGKAETGWSPLVDWPIAAVQGTAELFMERIPAAMVASTIMPALALLCFIFAAAWYGRSLLPGWRPVYTVLAVLFLWGLLRQFMPGRVDHHMWQAVLCVIAYGALMRIYFTPERLLYPLAAGGAFGAGLAIGVDIIPPLTFGTALLGLFWLVRGKTFERAGLAYGAALFMVALSCHLLLHDAGRLFAIYCDYLSPAWLSLAAAVLSFWGLVFILPARLKASWLTRLLCGGAVFVPLMAGLYVLFPACFHDPYQIDDPAVREIWLRVVSEARPLSTMFAEQRGAAVFFALPPFLALLAALWGMAAEKENRLLWGGLALVFLGALGLGFYQLRTLDFAQAISVAPLCWLFAMSAQKVGTLAGRLALTRGQRLGAASLFFAVMLVLFGVSMQKREAAKDTSAQIVSARTVCNVQKAAALLQTLPGTMTIAAHTDIGSELLFRTAHFVLAAPYHRNEAGIMAAYRILTAPDEAQARKAAEAGGADVLMICSQLEGLWTGGKAGENVFASALAKGQVPGWLEQIGDKGTAGGYLIYKVK